MPATDQKQKYGVQLPLQKMRSGQPAYWLLLVCTRGSGVWVIEFNASMDTEMYNSRDVFNAVASDCQITFQAPKFGGPCNAVTYMAQPNTCNPACTPGLSNDLTNKMRNHCYLSCCCLIANCRCSQHASEVEQCPVSNVHILL
jgi:hypothetical protein